MTLILEIGGSIADNGTNEIRQRTSSGGTGQPLTVHGADMTGGGDVGGRTNFRAGRAASGTDGIMALQTAAGVDALQIRAAGDIYIPAYVIGDNIDANILTSLNEQRVATAVGGRERTFVLKGTTLEAVMGELTQDGGAPTGANTILPPVGCVWTVLMSVSVICTVGTDINKFAAWLISCAVANIGGTTVMAFPGDQTLGVDHLWTDGTWKPTHYSDAALADCLLVPDATGAAGYFRVRAQGVAALADNTFKWTATIRATEV